MTVKSILSAGMIAVVAFSTAACTSDPYGRPPTTNQTVGVIGGAVAGGLIGSAFGGGAGKAAAIVAGAAIGGLLGGAIGSSLDDAARQRAYTAQYDAVSYGRRTEWRSDSGAYGYIDPGPAYDSPDGYCREYTHTIYVGGRPQRGYGTACQQPDGSWRIVS
ncbi:hypothetical protein QNA08_12275 [Chelatococcus sp. SYSU_G07232]|uniref:17 kDa surface antigen n=1 Tax=Chelatococcus albus TaxID=3047466 RepID=A0ABT7AI06_9HYPH|nr:hypothetical protein [Chelatococcus sp. SYSU_G07232]MDJ1159012.1 hypothetical protein [Chelatococcus sp. SYSU_G07232]